MIYLPLSPDDCSIVSASDLIHIDPAALQHYPFFGRIESVEIRGAFLSIKGPIEKLIQKCYTIVKTHSGQEPEHLDNSIAAVCMPSEGDTTMAKHKINQPVMINGQKRWITAGTMQEFTDKVIQLLGTPQDRGKHPFDKYAWNWYNTYSAPNVETATATTYQRQIRLYLIPAFDGLAVEDITVDDVQRLFNGMGGAKTTKDKARMVLNQILDSAVEEKLISSNPLKSRRLKITGKASKATPPYTVEQMRYLVQHIEDIQSPVDRAYLALQALHPLRLEEVLGLAPGDIDTNSMTIHIRRAVTHPTRNQPEVKDTKTESSHRTIGLSSLALPFL